MNYKRIADLSTGILAKFIDIYKQYLHPVENFTNLISKKPDVPRLLLTDIIHNGEEKKEFIQERFAAPKLPAGIQKKSSDGSTSPTNVDATTLFSVPKTKTSQFRDW
jgi:hypothetical protein